MGKGVEGNLRSKERGVIYGGLVCREKRRYFEQGIFGRNLGRLKFCEVGNIRT